MNDLVDRDTAAMTLFAKKLSDFSDSVDHKAATLTRMCDGAQQAMQDRNGPILAKRLEELADRLRVQVAAARALAGRINRSAALLEQSELSD